VNILEKIHVHITYFQSEEKNHKKTMVGIEKRASMGILFLPKKYHSILFSRFSPKTIKEVNNE